MVAINANMAANIAANSMTKNERSMVITMERSSNGLRMNFAKDDAAGLAILSLMTLQINSLNQAVRTVNDAISMTEVVEVAVKGITGMMQRMLEPAAQSIPDSNTSADRTASNNGHKELSNEVKRIAQIRR